MKFYPILGLLCLSLVIVCCQNETVTESSLTYEKHRAAQQHFQTDAGKMAYMDVGQGDAIILLHGVPTSSWMYRKIIPMLARNHRVVAVDFIGYGNSSKPTENLSVYSAGAQAKRVFGLASHLGIEKFSIITHDMGGLVTWEMMKQNLDRISNLCVLNTIVHRNGFNPPTIKKGYLAEQMVKAYSHRWTSAAVWMMTARNLGLKSKSKLNELECQGYVTPMREGADKALYQFFTSLDDALISKLDTNQEVMKKFKGNTLVLWGERDETLTSAQIPFLKTHLKIPDKNIHIYPENAHFLAEEIPEEVVTRVNEFLQ